jgi:hypothetical protein
MSRKIRDVSGMSLAWPQECGQDRTLLVQRVSSSDGQPAKRMGVPTQDIMTDALAKRLNRGLLSEWVDSSAIKLLRRSKCSRGHRRLIDSRWGKGACA